jgi:FMN reductase
VTVLEPAGTAVLVGNPKPRSRTWALAHAVVAHLLGSPVDSGASAVDGRVSIVDRSVSTVDLGAIVADPLGRGGAWAAALAAVPAATLLVVATPTYRGAYTGLLKLFADDLPPRALAGTVAVGVQTAAARRTCPPARHTCARCCWSSARGCRRRCSRSARRTWPIRPP